MLARKLLLSALVCACAAPMLVFAAMGIFTRPISDDFCHLDITAHQNILEAVVYWRHKDNGSFAHLVGMSLLGPLGDDVIGVYPALLLALLFASTAALMNACLRALGWQRDRWAIALALAALLVSAFCGSLYIFQPLYKYITAMKYLAVTIALTLYLLLLLHVARRAYGARRFRLATAAGAALSFLCAGFAETSALPQICGLTLLCGAILFARSDLRKRCLPFLYGSWLAAVACFAFMVSSPDSIKRVEDKSRKAEIASRSLMDILRLSLEDLFDRVSDPQALAGFALMLAAGMLLGLALPKLAASRGDAKQGLARAPLVFALVIQLLLMPMLWAHTSDYPTILGRYSGGYFVAIVLNAALVMALALWILARGRLASLLNRHANLLPAATLAAILPLFALTQVGSIHWRAYSYLWVSCVTLLVAVGWLLYPFMPRARTRAYAAGMAIMYGATWTGILAVAFAVNRFSTDERLRVYTIFAWLFVWQGLVWGVYLGRALKAAGGSGRLLRAGAAVAAIWLGGAMLAASLAFLPKMQTFASEFDAREAIILEGRAAGQRDFAFPPLTFDLPRHFVDVSPIDDGDMCALAHYDIDSISLEER